MIRLPVAHDAEGAALELQPGMHVLLQTIADGSFRECGGTLVDADGGTVAVRVPREELRLRRLSIGQKVTVQVEQAGQLYVFDTAVSGVQEVPRSVAHLDAPEKAHRFERREFYRLPAALDPTRVELRDGTGRTVRQLEATIIDISGGGIQFASPDRLRAGARVWLELPLGGPDSVLQAEVRVLHVEEPADERHPYRYHARFESLPARDRERIVRFIFQQQIEMRKKGLL